MQGVIFEDSPVSFNKRIFIVCFTIRAVSVDNVRKDDDRVFSLKTKVNSSKKLEFPVFVFTIYVISIASIVGPHSFKTRFYDRLFVRMCFASLSRVTCLTQMTS